MKKLFPFALVLLSAGCSSISYTATKPDGTRITASASSLFSNTAIKGFNSDSSTPAGTKTGLKFSASDTGPDNETIGAVLGAAVGAAFREKERGKQ